MKHRTYTILKWSFHCIFLLIVFFFVKNTIQPELHYHAQQPPFIFDWNFFLTFLRYPGGLAKYFTNFLLQSFYYPWFGSFVILGISLLFLLSCYFIIRSFDTSEFTYFLIYLPFILFIALLTDYYFPFVVAIRILFVFLALWILVLVLKKRYNFLVSFLVLSILIYYTSGSGSLLIFSVTSIVILALNKLPVKKVVFYSAFVVLDVFLIDIIAYKFIFPIYPENVYFSFLLEIDLYLDALMNYKTGFLCYFFCFSILLVVLTTFIAKLFSGEPSSEQSETFYKKSTVISLIIFIVISSLSYLLWHNASDNHQKNIILTDYYCYTEQWKRAIDVALSDPEYSSYINYWYNRAIDNYGSFPDLFFKYPQNRIFALYPDRMVRGNPSLSHIISDYYFDLGYISISQQWAQATLALMPNNKRALERMVITSLIYGNYKAAQTYLQVLSKNLVSKEFVDQYIPYISDTTLIAENELLMEKRLFMPRIKKIPDNITERFKVLLEQNNRNKRAYEHLQMSYLLVQNLEYFIDNLPEADTFYSKTPEIFEQAILMYVFITDINNLKKFSISENSLAKFKEYIRILNTYHNDKNSARSHLNKYAQSYMYYVTYFNPPEAIVKAPTGSHY